MRTGEDVVVEHDLFDVASRLREIDGGYFLVRRQETFEVHHAGDARTYCLTVPFPELDARTVDYVRKTRAARAAELFAEMDRENDRLQRDAIRSGAERLTVAAEDALSRGDITWREDE